MATMKSEGVHRRFEQIHESRGEVEPRNQRALERLTEQFETASREHGLDLVLLAMCDSMFGEISELMRKAGRIKGDSPDAGDMEKSANELMAVYDQVYAAYQVSTR